LLPFALAFSVWGCLSERWPRRIQAKENAMIELTEAQTRALDTGPQPAVAVDPRTGQEYLLIRREIYEKVRLTLKPFGRNWDNPADDDLIRKDV
jgi:hypothetical protein